MQLERRNKKCVLFKILHLEEQLKMLELTKKTTTIKINIEWTQYNQVTFSNN